jgi:hypothetical protein
MFHDMKTEKRNITDDLFSATIATFPDRLKIAVSGAKTGLSEYRVTR